ncbi:Putative outer membrane protein [Helicobacter mustelae 12198]|uniref:Putative outer membrane protein n=2 Tax=Helicobacter mustelae TaxID=217 RepID=D3UFU7_HELM1|nr:outer membrane protein [Helicobacter mustelae]CBG39368.1 Putative outer membrane protein [Helicobacter mustelae 12198]SQH70881.1 outer membrane protein [Helicobacter mustelae]
MQRYLLPFIFCAFLMADNPKDGVFVEGGFIMGMVKTEARMIPKTTVLAQQNKATLAPPSISNPQNLLDRAFGNSVSGSAKTSDFGIFLKGGIGISANGGSSGLSGGGGAPPTPGAPNLGAPNQELQNQIMHEKITQNYFNRANKAPLKIPNSNSRMNGGVNIMAGYQHYLNDIFGLSYYGILKYSYAGAHKTVGAVEQVSVGIGTNLLIDFHNKFIVFKDKDSEHVYREFVSSIGMFVGIRGLWNRYSMLGRFASGSNLNLATGFSYRKGHSKYSLGVSVPMISYDIKVRTLGNREISIKEGPSHFNVFFNYGWVF